MTVAPWSTALDELRSRGFTSEFAVDVAAIPPGVRCRTCGRGQFAERALMVDTPPAPALTAAETPPVVFGLVCPRCATKGVLVSNDAETTDLERELIDALWERALYLQSRPSDRTAPSLGG